MTDQQDEMNEIVEDFIIEATEILDDLDQKFIELEKDPQNEALLNDTFRSVHTIKGAAGFLGFKQVVEVAHKSEEILNKLRQNELNATPLIMDAVLQAVDMLTTLIGHVKERDGIEEDLSSVIDGLKAAETGVSAGGGESPGSGGATDVGSAPDSIAAKPPREQGKMLGEMLVDADVVTPGQVDEALKEQAGQEKLGEVLVRQGSVKKDVVDATLSKQSAAKESPKESSIRVDIKRLDDLLNMVGELVLGRNRLLKVSSQLDEEYGDDPLITQIKQTTTNLNLVTTDLQLTVMKTRMQPVAKVFNKFPRMVRDLARLKGKEIAITLHGEETELDKTVIEEIGDPLVHLIRNSVDHGIETPEERVKAGKPGQGNLVLSAFHKGSNIFITIEDDGGGLNRDRIKEKAIEKGIATEEELERMSDKEVANFIFHPGFSTASKITDVSGRGVGMDVVKTNIMRLNGTIDIDSQPGIGTKITLGLPLTLAIIQALMIVVGKEEYAIPLSSVVEILKIDESSVKSVEGREVIYSRDNVYPLIRLSSLLAVASESSEGGYAVIVALGEKRFALLVEDLLGQEEVVIKSMGNYLSNTDGVSGATITGEGRVVLILDIAGLFSTAKAAA
ncbi:MAG: chemotaxis protein CheA [Thermodesulfobacteriota bacterium]